MCNLYLLAALASAVYAQANEAMIGSLDPPNFTATAQAASFMSDLEGAKTSWAHKVTAQPEYTALLSTIPTAEASGFIAELTVPMTDPKFISAASAITTWPSISEPSSLEAFETSMVADLFCGEASIATKAGGSAQTLIGSCPANAANSARLGTGGGIWGAMTGVMVAGGIAGAALVL